MLSRIADGLRNSGVESVFALALGQGTLGSSDVKSLNRDIWKAAAQRFAKYRDAGAETVLVARCGPYAEFDVADLLAFHREQGRPLSRAVAADGPLDLWLADPSKISGDEDLETEMLSAESAHYEVRGYVNQLKTAQDFRRLILDRFSSRCRLRPRGVEIRPGVWMAENAEISRGARIVPPAFIGREVKIGDDCLITRGSNVEHGSEIDFGTAVEDSSILQKTYLGIGLDLTHSIADGRIQWNLRHDVTLEITDPVVMRPNVVSRRDRQPWLEFQEGLHLSAQGASK